MARGGSFGPEPVPGPLLFPLLLLSVLSIVFLIDLAEVSDGKTTSQGSLTVYNNMKEVEVGKVIVLPFAKAPDVGKPADSIRYSCGGGYGLQETG